jgi:hypothetical protein
MNQRAKHAHDDPGGAWRLILLALFFLFRLLIDYPRADRWGRPGILVHGEKKPVWHTRVSTLAKTLDDQNGLTSWKCVMVAGGAALRPDILAKIAARWPRTELNKAELNEYAEELKEAAAASAGANMGDALHEMVARVNRGEDFKPLPTFEADIKAYRDLLERHGLETIPEYVERTVVIEGLSEPIAGSFDLLVRKAGKLYVADLKTGQKLDLAWQAIAVQLTLYSRGTSLYRWEDDGRDPMPEVDQKTGLVIHLPAGSAAATLHVVDLVAGWEATQHALWARSWRKRKDIVRAAKAN